MNTCPCCSHILLKHFGQHREYWFCRHCWQEMPVFESRDSAFRSSYLTLEDLLKKHSDPLVSNKTS